MIGKYLLLWVVVTAGASVPKPRSFYNKSKSIIPDYYIKEVRPPTQGGAPVEIDFSMTVVDINSINVEDMDFRMDMFLSQEWIDARIKIPEDLFEYGDDSITLPSQYFDNLWQPDLYFLNSKVVEIATLTHKFSSVTLFRNKTIKYSARMHAIVACQMEFQHYPMDTQLCPISIESFSYSNKKMRLKWAPGGVTVSPELKLLQYNILPLQLEEKNVYTGEKSGNFSRLVVNFRFERQIGHHLIQTFAPSSLVVVLSWFSFWLGLDAVPGRVTLLVTCLLTLVTMFTGLRTDIPAVAYVKALDLWMAGCMVSVFAALGEFVIVKVLDQKYQGLKKKQCEQAMEAAITPWRPKPSIVNKRRASEGVIPMYWKNKKGKEKILWHQVDRVSRVVFPGLFFIFCAIYWTTLIFGRSATLL
ncbi:ligand-gated ion channel subunit precursor [Tribolium castaneum]|uniref:Ligand-gated ion channel subunit n=1 Tax=Tribolium castaneum TaxID=7070 RepID=A8DMV1_TRICA|nr:ligand-gated ion channel subunit precursor [Tribolium castaneum]XP_015837762.1 PREDICTED: ligand-gated ion channel subunit isoform X1 [Tribolium castaneum]ABU63606.1 ligand-gated ion channel subunit [Tribolium castaneum]EEZ99340.1 ligand-gated ion channel subunit [Tribolium castaneum]|eukprot:NP_001103243.1 ligand-gated ion channel subunit precursor [Tribolium castaneum]